MHLVTSLVAGIRGAENGHAEVFVRATSTRAIFYSDFIGTVHPDSGTDLTLDANGGAVIYVNELVDVEVFDENGSAVRDFTEGVSSPNTEVISDSFTGTDYITSASAAGKPTNLQTVLDRVKTSFGSIDWEVLFNGSSERLQDALGSIAGVFINVKSPEFGAKGDGATDDSTAIQNALNAATPLKAIVMFPSGTYIVNTKLTVTVGVSLWGLGPDASVISMNHGTNDTIEFSGAAGAWFQEMRNIRIKASVANTGKFVSVPSGALVAISNCTIGDSLHTGNIISGVGAWIKLERSSLVMYTSGGISADLSSTLNIIDCYVLALSAAYTGTLVTMSFGSIVGSTLSCGLVGSGAYVLAKFVGQAGTGPRAVISGNQLTVGSGTSTGLQITSGNEANTSVIEAGNSISGTFTTLYSGFGASTNNPQNQLISRDSRVEQLTNNTVGNVSVKSSAYGTTVLTRTAAGGAQAITADDSGAGPPGSFFTLVVYNNSGAGLGGAITATTGGFYAGNPTITLPANTKITVCTFRSVYSAGTYAWASCAGYQGNF